MALTREERKLLHHKSKQPTFGTGKPDANEGNEGDISFRKIEGSGTVEYVKQDGSWIAVASSGEMPTVRIVGGSGRGGSSSGVSNHGLLTGLLDDDHTQYLLIDGTRAMTSVMTIGADSDGTDRSITWGHSTLKTIMGIDDSSDAFVINTDAAFDATLANNSFSIDASHNAIIAGNLTIVGGDITLANGSTIDSSASAGTLLLTEDIVKSSAALQSTTTMTVGTDLTVTGGDIIYGNGQDADEYVTATAHDTAGKKLTITAGNTTAGTTNNIAGGNLVLRGGRGKGTGAGGDIIFKTANAGSSGSTLNSRATALTISDDLSATFTGALLGTTIDASTDFTIDGLVITADTITNDAALTVDAAGDIILDANSGVTKFYLAGDTDDLCTLTVGANGVTTIATADSDGAVGHLILDADGDIILDAAGDDIYFKDDGAERLRMDLDGTPTLAVTGAFTIDGSLTITIDGTTGVNIQEAGTNVINIDTDRYIYFHAYADNINYQNYAINNLANFYHFTTGLADFQQNFTMLHAYTFPEADKHETYPGA